MTSSRPGSSGSGRARAAARASSLRVVPIDEVGQVTSAISARWRPASSSGWRCTYEVSRSSLRANDAGASWRQRSQSMQLASTKKSPATFSGNRSASLAMSGSIAV